MIEHTWTWRCDLCGYEQTRSQEKCFGDPTLEWWDVPPEWHLINGKLICPNHEVEIDPDRDDGEPIKPAVYQPVYPVPPGRTMYECAKNRGWSVVELAEKLNLKPTDVLAIGSGGRLIDPDLAEKLEKLFGQEARFWLNLEANYRETLARLEEEDG